VLSPNRKLLVKHQPAESVNPAARRFGNSASPRPQIDCFSPAGKISPEKRRSIFRFPTPYSVMRSREVGATARRKAEQTDMTLKACRELRCKTALFRLGSSSVLLSVCAAPEGIEGTGRGSWLQFFWTAVQKGTSLFSRTSLSDNLIL
jgi:hypothetical protein